MRILDISPPVHPDAPVWPGDTPYALQPKWQHAAGDAVAVGTVTTTTHIGAHIDAPAHIVAGAATVEATPLAACIGLCLVVDVGSWVDRGTSPHTPAPCAAIVTRIRALVGEQRVARVLLRHARTAEQRWDDDMPGIDPEFLRWFASQGGVLCGIDLASFDHATSKELLAHHAGIANGVVLLEGLDLTAAPEGVAELIALPLPWRGADAAPVRAVLRWE